MSNLLTAHNQWATRPRDQRFHSLGDLYAHCNSRRSTTWQEERTIVDLEPAVETVDREDILCFRSNQGMSAPTHWSFGQYARMLGAPPAYLSTLPPKLAVDCLKDGFRQQPTLRTDYVKVMGGMEAVDLETDINRMRAVTSPSYGRIWDADVVRCVQRIVDMSEGKFQPPRAYVTDEHGFRGMSGETEVSGLFASDRDVFMFLIDGGSFLDGGGDKDQLNRGFIVTNSEVGSAALTILTCLFRGVCGNLIIWGAQDVSITRIRHSTRAGIRFDSEAYPALVEFANTSATTTEAMVREAKQNQLPWTRVGISPEGASQAQTRYAKEHGFTLSELRSGVTAANAFEGRCESVWDLVQGLTRFSQSLAYVDARISLDKRAGKLLPVSN